MSNINNSPTLAAVPSGESAPMVGNPRRIRGLDASILKRPTPAAALVGNPRRLRKLDPEMLRSA
jgi:hypothetical protein